MASSRVMFEDLAKVEKKFAATEVQLLHFQNEIQAQLFEDRGDILGDIPEFWSVVFEQAPQDIDQHISPSDSAALASLKSLEVTRFEIVPDAASGTFRKGDPRSLSFTWEFAENDYFTDKVITKKFWFRRADDGWTGLVSEPAKIHWKEGKDLTDGMLDLAVRVWEREKARAQSSNEGADLEPVEEYDVLVKKVEKMNLDSVSFFAWFGYRGRDVSSEESARATEAEEESMEKGKSVVRDSTAESEAKGKEPAEEEKGEPTEEASKEEQSESGSEYMSAKEDLSEEDEVSPDEDMSEEDEVSPDEDMSTEGNVSEDDNMSEDDDMSEDKDASNDPFVSDSSAREIFPAGEDLAIALSEDLFPNAIQYFIEAHTQAAASASEPSDESDFPDENHGLPMDPPDLEDSALMRMVEEDGQRAAKRKRI